jgi:cystathionine gamma-synthase/methionine-gamma-lyase
VPQEEKVEKNAFSTRALHVGEPADPVHGAVEPSLVLSTNFVADPATVGFSAEDLSADSPYFYSRWATPTVHALEEKLASLEGGEAVLCFASGMGAIAGLLLGTLRAGDHLVLSDVCYAGLAELARNTLPGFGIEVTTVDFSDLESVAAAVRKNTRLLWAETPANPILRLTDIAAAANIAHAAGAEFVVDSTMATPVATRPLALGADYVVHSLTKYLNGHGDALGGAIIGRRAPLAKLRQGALIHFGGALSPFNAWLIRRGLHTLELRMQAHEKSALHVARFLESHPAITRVIYPGLASHPQHALALRQMKNFSGMLTFQTKAPGGPLAEQLYKKLRVFTYAVSLGKQRSLLWHIPTDAIMESSFHLTGKALESYRAYAGDGVFRVSIGLEAPEDLCRDLDQALES